MADRTPTIVGIGLSDHPVAPHLDAVGHHVLAMQRALADAGVSLRDIDGFTYVNTGDWVESCTAAVEHADGRMEIIRWAEHPASILSAPRPPLVNGQRKAA